MFPSAKQRTIVYQLSLGFPSHSPQNRSEPAFKADAALIRLAMSSASTMSCGLTVKLRGRPEGHDQAPRAHTVFCARGADTQAVHGPLQRLLEVRIQTKPAVAAAPLPRLLI